MSHMPLREAVMDSPLTLDQIVSRIDEKLKVRFPLRIHETPSGDRIDLRNEETDTEETDTEERAVEVADLCRWVSGRGTPPTPVKLELARILDHPVEELFPEWAQTRRTRGAVWRRRQPRGALRIVHGWK